MDRYMLVYYHDFEMHYVLLRENENKYSGYTNVSVAKRDKRRLEEKYPQLSFYIAKETTMNL